MDLRTGDTYSTLQEALDAGVPESDIALVRPPKAPGEAPEVTVSKGPFKGRVYKRTDEGHLVRVR